MSQVTTWLKAKLCSFMLAQPAVDFCGDAPGQALQCLGRCSEEREGGHQAGTKCPATALGLCHQNFPKKQMQELERPGKARHCVISAKCLCAVLSAGTQEHFLASEVR